MLAERVFCMGAPNAASQSRRRFGLCVRGILLDAHTFINLLYGCRAHPLQPLGIMKAWRPSCMASLHPSRHGPSGSNRSHRPPRHGPRGSACLRFYRARETVCQAFAIELAQDPQAGQFGEIGDYSRWALCIHNMSQSALPIAAASRGSGLRAIPISKTADS